MLVEHEHFLWLFLAVELKDIILIFDDLMGLCVALLVKILRVWVNLVLHHRQFRSVIKFWNCLQLSIACRSERNGLPVFNELPDAKHS